MASYSSGLFTCAGGLLIAGLALKWAWQAAEAGDSNKLGDRPVATLEEVLAAGRDLWGEAAIAQPDGPTYGFFAGLLPPLRYVNTKFRHYPIVLSAPRQAAKIRLVSNGSAVNARAEGGWAWHEVGQPVHFRLGAAREPYGENLENLSGPRYVDGWLPLVQFAYRSQAGTVEQEVFAGTSDLTCRHGVAFVRFVLTSGEATELAAELPEATGLSTNNGVVVDAQGRVVVWTSSGWRWLPESSALVTTLRPGEPVYLAIMTTPVPAEEFAGGVLTMEIYDRERAACVDLWNKLLARGGKIVVPEARVNHAWRALLVSLLMIAVDDKMNYSAQNAYATTYAEESSSSVHSLLMYGLTDEARPFVHDILRFNRQPNLRFHNAAFKLQLLTRYYWLTRDAEFVRSTRPVWQPEVEAILTSREAETGLLPREDYCGDIHNKVHNLSTNASCWRAIRDWAAVLEDMGEGDPRLAEFAVEFRKAIIAAVRKSVDNSVDPPFVPIALFGEEKAYSVLTASMLGSYWVLMSNYVLRSGVFDKEPEINQWIVDYLEQRGGLCMGLLRFDQHSGLFANTNAVDDLYTLGYVLHQLKVDRVERALVTFYGKLAQGLTWDTFIGAEGTGLVPLDRFGRPMYLPPNTASASLFLWMLRYLVVQDWDVDDDGKPETLRLLFATPQAWLKDGGEIRLERMPTAFGPVSACVRSALAKGQVEGWIELPPRQPERVWLRLRLPRPWTISSATVNGLPVRLVDSSVVDLTGLSGRIDFVAKASAAME